MKKILGLLAISILVLAGCGSSNSEKGITVGIWGTPTEIAFYEEQGKKFTEESGVPVTFKQYTEFDTEIQAELIGGTAPDIFYVEAFMLPFFQEQGVLEELDANTYELADFNSNLVEAFKVDDKQYAVPKDYSTLALYYNKDLVNGDDIPSKYEDLATYLPELQKTLPSDVIAMTYNIDLSRDTYLAQMSGDKIVNPETDLAQFSQPSIINNLSLQYDMAIAGTIKTPSDLGFGWNGESFGNGKNAIMIEGNWVIGELDTNYPSINYGVKEIPTVGDKNGSALYTVGWGMNSASKNKEDSEKFIKYFSSAAVQEEISKENGVLPSRDAVATTLGLDSNEKFGAHIVAADYATAWKAGTTLKSILTEYANYIPSVSKKERTLTDALKEIDMQSNQVIEANN